MKAVLAYSGGLDTSVCIKLLQEKYGFDVITVTVNVGIDEKELEEIEEKAYKLGVLKHYTIDARKEFVEDFIFRAIKANACYEGYYLSTALARPLIALKVVEVAKKENANVIAHGSTGKGNDQFRFETIFRAFGYKVVAPIRELNLTRKASIEYAKKHGIPVPVDVDKPFSIDENLWGRSIEGGILENPESEPIEDVFEWTKIRKKDEEEVVVEFREGVPVSINNEKLDPVEIVIKANEVAGAHGIGRVDIIEDRILGIKSREVYENPGAHMLITAHKALEQIVLTKEELFFKEFVDKEWSKLIYHGHWLHPLKEALDAFIDKTQQRVNGWVKLRLGLKSLEVIARGSPNSLYSKEVVSFDEETIDQNEVKGMLKYHALQTMLTRRFRDA